MPPPKHIHDEVAKLYEDLSPTDQAVLLERLLTANQTPTITSNRSSTPPPQSSKRTLGSPETPNKGISRKVLLFINSH
jgi:hypothetical protein